MGDGLSSPGGAQEQKGEGEQGRTLVSSLLPQRTAK